jgi:hypothetical protein
VRKWTLVGKGKACSTYGRTTWDQKRLGATGISTSLCQALAEADSECGVNVWGGDGKGCNCKLKGKECILETSYGYTDVYQVGCSAQGDCPSGTLCVGSLCTVPKPVCPKACFGGDEARWNGQCKECVSQYGWCGSTPAHCLGGTDCSRC